MDHAIDRIDLKDLPSIKPGPTGKVHPFYDVAGSKEWRESLNILMINELRGSNPSTDSDERNRALLGKLQGMVLMMDIESVVRSHQAVTTDNEDELPQEEEDPFN